MEIPEVLYDEIRRKMPIPCVDLIPFDDVGRVLLLRRANSPAKGEWWFPGGRIWVGETRQEAVDRKLLEEVGLRASEKRELGTFDLIFRNEVGMISSHGITTLFLVLVAVAPVIFDDQSVDYRWLTPAQWLSRPLHVFIRSSLGLLVSAS